MQIEMRGIDKALGTNQVLKIAGFELRDGEIHALMGETGSGKRIPKSVPVEVTLITKENA